MLRLLVLLISLFLFHHWSVQGERAAAVPAPTEPELCVQPEGEEPARPTELELTLDDVPMPSAESVAGLPAEETARVAAAIKATLLQRDLRLVEDSHQLTPENLRACAGTAEQLQAPAFWVNALRLMAQRSLNGRENNELELRMDRFCELYGVNTLTLRLMVEASGLDPAELREVLRDIPTDNLFNLPTEEEPAAEELARQGESLVKVFTDLKAQLTAAKDKESADAAAMALLPDLELYDKAQPVRMLPPPAQAAAFAENAPVISGLLWDIRALRLALRECHYHGSLHLRLLDYLLG